MIFGFADVFGQVIELDGLALVSAFSPAAGASGRNVLPVVVAKAGCAANGATYGSFPNRLAATFQQGEKAEAVFSVVVGKIDFKDVGEGSEKVSLVNQLVIHRVGFHHFGPTDDEGDSVTSFPYIGFVSAKWTAWKVTLLFELGSSDVVGTTVIAGEDDEGVFRGTAFVQSFEDLANNGIGFDDEVSIEIQTTLALPLFVHGKGSVWRSEGEVEEERVWCFGLPFDERGCTISKGGKNGLQSPTLECGTLLAGLVFDEKLRITKLGGNADSAFVFDVAIGRPVGNIRTSVLVKTNGCRPAFDRFGKHFFTCRPMLISRLKIFFATISGTPKILHFVLRNGPVPTQVPFANAGRLVPLLLSQRANGHAFRWDDRCPPQTDNSTLQS